MEYRHRIGEGHQGAVGFEIDCNMLSRRDFANFSTRRARNRRENRIGMQSDGSNSNSPQYQLMPLADHAAAQPSANWPLATIPVERRVATWILILVLVITQLLIAYFQLLAFPTQELGFRQCSEP